MGRALLTLTILIITAASGMILSDRFLRPLEQPLDTFTQAGAGTNLQKISSALAMYYLDRGTYPKVNNEQDLVELLIEEGYMRMFIKPVGFEYRTIDEGQDYILKTEQ